MIRATDRPELMQGFVDLQITMTVHPVTVIAFFNSD